MSTPRHSSKRVRFVSSHQAGTPTLESISELNNCHYPEQLSFTVRVSCPTGNLSNVAYNANALRPYSLLNPTQQSFASLTTAIPSSKLLSPHWVSAVSAQASTMASQVTTARVLSLESSRQRLSHVEAEDVGTDMNSSKLSSISNQQDEAQLEAESRSKNAVNCFKLLFSGAMSAVVSRTCVAPLERVKMELILKQNAGGKCALSTAQEVFRTEGVTGFWRGNLVNILRTAPFKALNFFSFDKYHQLLVQWTGEDGNIARFAGGALAGLTATMACFPLDVVRTRLLAKGNGLRYGGPFQTIAGIVKHEGPSALYSGVLPALIGMAPAGAIFYGLYDLLKHRHLEAVGAPPPPGTVPQLQLEAQWTLLYGALSGMASEIVLYPLEVVRRRIQLQSMVMAAAKASSMKHTAGLMAVAAAAAGGIKGAVPGTSAAAAAGGLRRVALTCQDIWKAEGPAGFYAGMAPNLIQVLPSSALSYYTYDRFKVLLQAQV